MNPSKICNSLLQFFQPFERLVSSKSFYILKLTCGFQVYVCLTMYDVVVGTRRHVSSLTCFILTWWKWRTKVFEGAVSVSNFKLIGHIFCTIFTNARSVFTLSFLYYLPFITEVASTRKRSVRSEVTSIRYFFQNIGEWSI